MSKHHFLLTYAVQRLNRPDEVSQSDHIEAIEVSVEGWQRHAQISHALSGILELTGRSVEARKEEALVALTEPLREALSAHDASFDTMLHVVALIDRLGPPVVFQV